MKKTNIIHLQHTAELCEIAGGMVFGLTDNTDARAQMLTHARIISTPYQRARAHARTYSKRFNGLINNASALHVYAIYRARPSDSLLDPGAH